MKHTQLGARALLGAPGLTARSKGIATSNKGHYYITTSSILTTSNKKLLIAMASNLLVMASNLQRLCCMKVHCPYRNLRAMSEVLGNWPHKHISIEARWST